MKETTNCKPLITVLTVNWFSTEYIKLLDCSFEKATSLAEIASRKGWIVYKRIGDIMEVQFPNLFTKEELGWIYEQN